MNCSWTIPATSEGQTGLWNHLLDTRRKNWEGDGTPLQYSCLETPMDRGAWWAAVHGVTKSRTWLSDFTFAFHFHALEKEMATHSSVLAWRIPGTAEPGGLPSMGSHRVRHDWSDLAAAVLSPINAEMTSTTPSSGHCLTNDRNHTSSWSSPPHLWIVILCFSR